MSTTVAEPRSVTPARARRPRRDVHRQILEAMTGLMAALFTAMLSSTIVATALPTIIGDLHGTQRQYTWVITASLLATTVSTPIWGKLSDLFSKKLLVQLSIVVFVVGSVAAGLCAHRAVPHRLPRRPGPRHGRPDRARAVDHGLDHLPARARPVLRLHGRGDGRQHRLRPAARRRDRRHPLGWRWCFYVCVPLALISLFVLQATLHVATERRKVQHRLPRRRADRRRREPAAAVGHLRRQGLRLVSLADRRLPGRRPPSPLALAVVVELKVPEPLVPLRVLRNRTAALVIVASVAVGIAMFGGTTFLGQYFQVARGYTPDPRRPAHHPADGRPAARPPPAPARSSAAPAVEGVPRRRRRSSWSPGWSASAPSTTPPRLAGRRLHGRSWASGSAR